MLIEIDKQSLFEIYIRRFNDKRIASLPTDRAAISANRC